MTNSHTVRWPVIFETSALLFTYALGTALCALAWPPLALGYVALIVGCNLLFMAWICPYCRHCEERTCHSGYHHIARFFRPKANRGFAQQFRRNVAVVYPVWFLPPVAGVVRLVADADLWSGVVLALFCLSGFVALPLASRQICAGCVNAPECPRGKGASADGIRIYE